jgi:putative DNA primase/helicase
MTLQRAALQNLNVNFIKSADVTLTKTTWIWKDWLASGKLHVLAGDAGIGKTQIAIDVAARISRGSMNPDGTSLEAGSIIFYSEEDDYQDALKPRLIRAGANEEKIHFIRGTTNGQFDLSSDVWTLLLSSVDIPDLKLVVVDPIITAVRGDSNQANQVRRALAPLVTFAGIRGAAILGITHFSKGTQGKNPLERVSGSNAFGALPRLVWLAAKGVNGNVLVRAKSNYGPTDGGLGYDITVKPINDDPEFQIPGIQWTGPLSGDARYLIGDAEKQSLKRSEACQFLVEALSSGERLETDLEEELRGQDFKITTLRNAKKLLGVESVKRSDGRWVWRLPQVEHKTSQDDDDNKPASQE